MGKYMIPAGTIGIKGTPEAFAFSEAFLGALPPGPVLATPDGSQIIRLFLHDGPLPRNNGMGLEFLPAFTVIETA